MILQKSAYLAGENGVELSAFFNKKIGAGLFGGEGFIMQKASGHGIMFAEFDGHVVEYELEAGEQIVVDTGHLAAMTASCTMERICCLVEKECLTQYLQALGKYGCKQCQSVM